MLDLPFRDVGDQRRTRSVRTIYLDNPMPFYDLPAKLSVMPNEHAR